MFNLKAKYSDASHICYAYRIKEGPYLDEFASDSGEPKGRAGQPILNSLKRQNLINASIIVIRYYGGSKLGIPGLIHAYGMAAKNAIDNAKLIIWFDKKRLFITYPYELEGVIKSILKMYQTIVINEDFGERIYIQLEIDEKSADKFIDNINELSSGSATINIIE